MVGLRWAETWGLAFGAQEPLCSSRSVLGHELSKEGTCPWYRSPAHHPLFSCRLGHRCPPPSPSPGRSPHHCSVSKKTTGIPVTSLLLFAGLARSRKGHFYCSLLVLLGPGKVPGVTQGLGRVPSCRCHFLLKLCGLREEKEEEEYRFFTFFSHCCGVTGMGMNPFPGSHQQNLLKGRR